MHAPTATVSPVERLCNELRLSLRAGADIDAESVLAEHEEVAADPEAAAELIAAEFAERVALGQSPSPMVWLLRYREWRGPLRRRLAAMGVVPAVDSDRETLGGKTVSIRPIPRPSDEEFPEPPALPSHQKLEFISAGGMGVVHKAVDTTLGRVVAMKSLKSGPAASARDRARFYREARVAGKLDHPNIVPVYHLGVQDGEDCFTMPFYGKGSLAGRLAAGRMRPKAAAAMLVQIVRGVQAAHEAGIVHRDLKPGNILFDDGGAPRVADFGLAQFDDGERLTRTGAAMGTYGFMPPEQAAGQQGLGVGADVFALGAMLHAMLAGRPPSGPDGHACRAGVSHEMPPGLRTIVMRCLAPLPKDRFASAAELGAALEAWLGGDSMPVPPPVPPENRRWGIFAVVLMTLPLLMGAMLLVSPEPEPDRKEAWLKWVAKELKAGRPVTLVGPTGLPRWYEWRTHANRTPLEATRGPTAFTAAGMTYLELLPSVPIPEYKLVGDVTLLNTADGASAGLYALGSEEPVLGATEHDQYTAGYTIDRTALPLPLVGARHFRTATFDRGAASGHRFRPPNRQPLRPTALALAAALVPPAPVTFPAALAGHDALHRTGTFHRVELEVTSSAIRASFDGFLIDALPRMQAGAFFASHWRLFQLARAPLPPRPVPPFDSAGRAGLFLTAGKAAFRNVQIVPVPRPEE